MSSFMVNLNSWSNVVFPNTHMSQLWSSWSTCKLCFLCISPCLGTEFECCAGIADFRESEWQNSQHIIAININSIKPGADILRIITGWVGGCMCTCVHVYMCVCFQQAGRDMANNHNSQAEHTNKHSHSLTYHLLHGVASLLVTWRWPHTIIPYSMPVSKAAVYTKIQT